ncbi:ribosomal protein S5 domain 2-type protein [Phlyctochytrium arcticum]|nr:ribosomal protein S5 domain 2-type protein [Phlyctochytrium arcticum]
MSQSRSRPDKRKSSNEMRPFYCSSGLLSRSDGSVRFKSGDTAVLSSIYGPMEVKIKDEKLDKATIEVIFKPAAGPQTTKERFSERMIRETLESAILGGLHPRTMIRVTLQVLTDDGGILATALNAATLSLVDAGIPLRSLPAAVCCMIDDDGELLLDPIAIELERAKSTHLFVFDKVSDGTLANISTGSFSLEEYSRCYETCKLAAASVQQLFRTSSEGKVRREYVA